MSDRAWFWKYIFWREQEGMCPRCAGKWYLRQQISDYCFLFEDHRHTSPHEDKTHLNRHGSSVHSFKSFCEFKTSLCYTVGSWTVWNTCRRWPWHVKQMTTADDPFSSGIPDVTCVLSTSCHRPVSAAWLRAAEGSTATGVEGRRLRGNSAKPHKSGYSPRSFYFIINWND